MMTLTLLTCPAILVRVQLTITRLTAMEYRGAVVGPHGVGKTTLLETLSGHLEKCVFRSNRTLVPGLNRTLVGA